jgi:hypothetical protein
VISLSSLVDIFWAEARRSAADCGEYCQAAGAIEPPPEVGSGMRS